MRVRSASVAVRTANARSSSFSAICERRRRIWSRRESCNRRTSRARFAQRAQSMPAANPRTVWSTINMMMDKSDGTCEPIERKITIVMGRSHSHRGTNACKKRLPSTPADDDAALNAAMGSIRYHAGTRHAPQSSMTINAIASHEPDAYSPTAAQHTATSAPHIRSRPTSPDAYTPMIMPMARNTAWNSNRFMPPPVRRFVSDWFACFQSNAHGAWHSRRHQRR